MYNDFGKITKAMRYWLLGRGYFTALKAFNIASDFHTSVRKNGITPEFEHQMIQAHYARTLEPFLKEPETVIAVAFLHDIIEDYNLSDLQLKQIVPDHIVAATNLISKKIDGKAKDDALYYAEMADCPITSVNKLLDRIHNIETILDAFSREKQESYIAHTRHHVLKMAQVATHNFPEQKNVYQTLTKNLKDVMALTEYVHEVQDGKPGGVSAEHLSLPAIWQGQNDQIDEFIQDLDFGTETLTQRQELIWRNKAKIILPQLKELRLLRPETEQVCEFYKGQILTRLSLMQRIEQERRDHNKDFSRLSLKEQMAQHRPKQYLFAP